MPSFTPATLAKSLAAVALQRPVAKAKLSVLHEQGFLREPKAARAAITCKGLALFVEVFGTAKPSDVC